MLPTDQAELLTEVNDAGCTFKLWSVTGAHSYILARVALPETPGNLKPYDLQKVARQVFLASCEEQQNSVGLITLAGFVPHWATLMVSTAFDVCKGIAFFDAVDNCFVIARNKKDAGGRFVIGDVIRDPALTGVK